MIVGTAGHIDHGKTALVRALTGVDADRLAEEKSRGITIELGFAYADLGGGGITGFVDVPGHERLVHTMLAGAGGIDLALLVVAADDAVMPQTVEAIAHAKAANVPMIVAINKIDKPTANPQKVRTDLLQHEVVVEAMSGEVQDVEVSAHTGQGLDELLEAIALQAEILELKANPGRAAQGVTIFRTGGDERVVSVERLPESGDGGVVSDVEEGGEG